MLSWSCNNKTFKTKNGNVNVDSIKLFYNGNKPFDTYFYEIKLEKDGKQLINVSETFDMASEFSDSGIAVVVKSWNDLRPYRFLDLDFNLSKESYAKANRFYNNYALVQKKEGGKYQYVNAHGNLSVSYNFASNYSRYLPGYGLVQKKKGGNFQFQNMFFELGEEFYSIEGDFENGCIPIHVTENGPICYIDLSGRIIKKPDIISDNLKKVYDSIDNLDSINSSLFMYDAFVNGVLNILFANNHDKKYFDILYKKIEKCEKSQPIINLLVKTKLREQNTILELSDVNLDKNRKKYLQPHLSLEINSILSNPKSESKNNPAEENITDKK